jgi:Cu-Zn family superoxide dismutase
MRSVLLATCLFLIAGSAYANELKVKMYEALETGQGKELGTISIRSTSKGLEFKPVLQNVPAGDHGFHIHENPDCNAAVKDNKTVAALAAGGHFDPDKTSHHMGPEGEGHLGDLPALHANAKGRITTGVIAPRLKSLSDVKGRSLMIHFGDDNYSDEPKPLGGGGARFACGVIE